ncbi:hypothetical protein Ahy_Scaffold2g107664 [Arachis hypogaea]|uniref:Uncharacterized protein n=1 Tax=Arachis hypogaea TaxID=3818 RepID=A0A444WQK6_ARAHY|nr:hypothetical protein Ahy_Scaffold2g107664 [Arachis hypogaea]
MMQDVHEGCNHLTIWFCPDIKKELVIHFSTNEGFKYRHLMNRTNKALPRSSKYIGGSVTFMKTKSKLSKSLEHEATSVESFKYIYMLKANMERFNNERSTAHYAEERYKELLAHVGDTVDIRAELTEKLERLEHLRDQMVVYNEKMRAGGSDTTGGHRHQYLVCRLSRGRRRR